MLITFQRCGGGNGIVAEVVVAFMKNSSSTTSLLSLYLKVQSPLSHSVSVPKYRECSNRRRRRRRLPIDDEGRVVTVAPAKNKTSKSTISYVGMCEIFFGGGCINQVCISTPPPNQSLFLFFLSNRFIMDEEAIVKILIDDILKWLVREYTRCILKISFPLRYTLLCPMLEALLKFKLWNG